MIFNRKYIYNLISLYIFVVYRLVNVSLPGVRIKVHRPAARTKEQFPDVREQGLARRG